jgi:hypothetical protein
MRNLTAFLEKGGGDFSREGLTAFALQEMLCV